MVTWVRMLDITLSDISLGEIAMFLIVFVISAIVIGSLMVKRKVQEDDELPAFEVTGRVIEKSTSQEGLAGVMTFSVEQILIEDETGMRRQFRNIRTKEIYISTGDRCRMTVRGHTIYEYTRLKE